MADPRQQFQAALTNPDTYASVLVVVVLDEYGMEALEWDPQTLLLELEDDFQVKIPTLSFDRLCAGIQLVTTDKFYKSLPDFIQLCPILAGHVASDDLDIPDALECSWGITECALLNPPDDDEPFTPEICAFIGQICSNEGLRHPKGMLRIATLPSLPEDAGEADFSDDPTMYSAMYSVGDERADDIEQRVRHGVHELLMQLSCLTLRNGDGSKALQALQRQSSR